MPEPIITVENLSKRYIIGHQRDKQDGLRHVLERTIRSPRQFLRLMRERRLAAKEEFWALRDVNLEVNQGEVVGIIGRNGAGKSTLLKILSRITEPTKGRITLNGRVASLLEVGTGFHPELTARENIFLNGAILGMSRVEIKSKFDEIVAFSEIEKFLDTPVKRFSSGMYVRLAFAVAAHLEPEILIVDEVLAVGDAAFQKKCLGRMSIAAQGGRTVLFVSHNMPIIANLCPRCVMLRSGTVVADGPTADVIGTYLGEASGSDAIPLSERTDRIGSGDLVATGIDVLDRAGNRLEHAMSGQNISIRINLRSRPERCPRDCRVSLVVTRDEQVYCVLSSTMVHAGPLDLTEAESFEFMLPELPLTAGIYSLDSIIESNQVHDIVRHAAEISIVDGDFFGTGHIRPTSHWKNVGVLVRHTGRAIPRKNVAASVPIKLG